MSSIRKVQLERLLLDVAYSLYSKGVRPTDTEFSSIVSRYLSEYPAGSPLPLPLRDDFSGTKSNTEDLNLLIEYIKINLDVLYEASLRQVDTVLQLAQTMSEDLERLKKRRRALESEVNNYLLAAENTGDYFYSFGEPFASLNAVDLSLTTAQIDLESGSVSIPALPYMSTTVPSDQISLSGISVSFDGESKGFEEIAPFANAVEADLSNLFWGIRVASSTPGEVVVAARVALDRSPVVSRIDYDPYGPVEVQSFITTGSDARFERIVKTSDKTSFLTAPAEMDSFTLNLRKTEHDYTQVVNGQTVYYYLLGAKSLKVSKFVYDTEARIISTPISIPEDINEESAIDAVSLEVTENIPENTDIKYYIGASSGEVEAFSSVAWREIVPVGGGGESNFTLTFNGTSKVTKPIRRNARGEDIQMVPLKDHGPLAERNPTALMIDGVDVYRIAEINNTAIPNSVSLIEGLNTTRIRSKSIDPNTDFENDINLEYWANENQGTQDYARIDAGNDFFYSGDVGAVGKDIYVETFLEADRSYETFLERFSKLDARSQQWDVKVFLNGRELGYLPPGRDSAQLPWTIRQGLNHVVLLVRIPREASSNSYLGSIELMRESKLYDYGTVRLSEWEYVTPFEMQYNQVGDNVLAFTVLGREIVSRRKPTDNFQVKYTLKSGQSPEFLRFRADLTRSQNSPSSTPVLNDYRIRFSYVDGE